MPILETISSILQRKKHVNETHQRQTMGILTHGWAIIEYYDSVCMHLLNLHVHNGISVNGMLFGKDL